MKATELRIGNKVIFDGEISTIDAIQEKIASIKGASCWYNYDYFEGIPLTEEWLAKFGFEVKEAIWFSIKTNNRWIRLEVCIKEKRCILFNSKSINFCDAAFPKSVHQLQNLYFALTGEELMPNPQ